MSRHENNKKMKKAAKRARQRARRMQAGLGGNHPTGGETGDRDEDAGTTTLWNKYTGSAAKAVGIRGPEADTIVTHLTLNSGNIVFVGSASYMVPDRICDALSPAVRQAVIQRGKGVPVPSMPLYRLRVEDTSPFGMSFTILRQGADQPIVLCLYELAEMPMWEQTCELFRSFIPPQIRSKYVEQGPPKPPALITVVFPSIAVCPSADIAVLGNLEQCIAETWRRRVLPMIGRTGDADGGRS
jgi:hypothetical protein